MSNQRKRLPHEIDPFRLAESRSVLEGSVPLKQFTRLGPLLVKDTGVAAVVLNFDTDELGVPFVTGSIEADLALVCQRCLEEYNFPIAKDFTLALIKTEKDAESLPLRFEPYLVETNPLILNDVIEDELLLALPQIPMHSQSDCTASSWINNSEAEVNQDEVVTDSEKENPFSVLANLKRKD